MDEGEWEEVEWERIVLDVERQAAWEEGFWSPVESIDTKPELTPTPTLAPTAIPAPLLSSAIMHPLMGLPPLGILQSIAVLGNKMPVPPSATSITPLLNP